MSPRTETRSPLVTDKILEKDPSEWSEDEHRFLQDRDLLPGGVDRVPVTFNTPSGGTISNDAAYFASQQLAEQDQETFERQVEERARALAAQMVQEQMRSQQHTQGEYHGNAIGQPPTGGTRATDHGEPDDDEAGEVDYTKLHNDDLRAECARRNLSVDGNKKDLVERLERDDAGEATEEDEA